jgi:Ca2+ transporting ATPase
MFKHVLGQAFFQLIIMLVVVMSGESWLPEYSDDFDDEIAKNIAEGNTILS